MANLKKKNTRVRTEYPGVFYRTARRLGGRGKERVYYIVFRKNGKIIEEKAGRQYADSMTPAKAALMRSARIENRRPSRKESLNQQVREEVAGRWPFDRLWEAYKESKPELKGIVTDENRYNNYIRPDFGDQEPKDLTPLALDIYRNSLLKKKKPGTVRNILELIRRLANFGEKKNLCSGLGFVLEMPRVDNEKTEDLTAEQLKRLLEVIESDSHHHAGRMMKFVLFTGMRRGELFRLQWKDVDFEAGFILLRNPKGGKDVRIPINSGAKAILDELKEESRERNRELRAEGKNPVHSAYVFPGREGKQRTDINKQIVRIKKEAGLPKNFRPLQGLRHVFASMLASSGQVDLYTLQRLLTHKSPQMTQRYAHLRDEALKKASSVASNLITLGQVHQ